LVRKCKLKISRYGSVRKCRLIHCGTASAQVIARRILAVAIELI